MNSDCPPLIVLRAWVAHAATEYDKSKQGEEKLSAIRTMRTNLPVANGIQIDKRYVGAARKHQDCNVRCQDKAGNWTTIEFRDPNVTLYEYMMARGLDFDTAEFQDV